MRKRPSRGRIGALAFAAWWLASGGACQESAPPNLTSCLTGVADAPPAWSEADGIFRRDPLWLGGDGAYSVGLPDGRVIWFFDDSFVATGGPRDRRHATFVHNSIGVQSGPDPTRATVAFSWGIHTDGSPHSFFEDPPGKFYGIGVPVMLDGALLVFLWEEQPAGLFARVTGWNAALVANPGDPPDNWTVRMLDPPQTHPASDMVWAVGGGGVLVDGDYLYAHVTETGTLDAYLVRFPIAAVGAGDLSGPEWWCGAGVGWVGAAGDPAPAIVLAGAGTEFSVQRLSDGSFVMAAMVGSILDGPHANLALRTAPAITGPWSDPVPVYHPPESDLPGVFTYAGKSHPEIGSPDMVLTYGANAFDLARTIDDMCIYYPRFVRIAAPGGP